MTQLDLLLIDANSNSLEDLFAKLDKTIPSLERDDIVINIIKTEGTDAALEQVTDNGDIQAVVIHWQSADQPAIGESRSLIESIKKIRLELPIYILGDDRRGFKIINESELIESFFYIDDVMSDPESILGYIVNDFDDRCQTPFWTAYKRYVLESNDSWHTPGHSGGSSFRNSAYIKDFYNFYGRNVFAGDLSVSVDFLGSLSDSSHYIGKAQQAAAFTFESKRTYFVTNGSSTSNKIVLQTLLRNGDQVIVDRNCHKSVHYGVMQAQAMPIYLSSILNTRLGIFAPPSLANIKAAITGNPDAKLLVLTGCTYDGLLSDLHQVVAFAHEHGVKVFIDEAWFAYSLFHPSLRYYSAIDAGADYVTHSAHKVVSAFSQASYIHINDPDFDEDFFREIFSIYASTSPKYQLIASLDVCHKQLEMEGYKILHGLLKDVEEFKQQINDLPGIRLLDIHDFKREFGHFEGDNMGHDPLKMLLDISELPFSVRDIHQFLMDEIGLEIEKYTHATILVLLTLGGTHSKLTRLYNALRKLTNGKVKLSKSRKVSKLTDNIPDIELSCLPHEAFYGKRVSVPLQAARNRICANLVTPYPPGIPVLVPGQLIQSEHIDFISMMASQNLTIQGSYDGEIYVLDD